MELRRQNRIVYQTKIRLRAPGRDDSVIARVQNLSPRGVYVTGSELPAVGTVVQCRLLLAGERRTLSGRVAWVRPASKNVPLRSPGAGIEFLDLGEKDTHLLRRLLDPGAGEREPVDVWFEGMKAPIRCQAVVAGDGLLLATRLPFMRLQSPVRVTFTQQQPVSTREGTLDSVMLEPNSADGIPHLQLNVSMGAEVSAPQVVIASPTPADQDRTQRFTLPGPLQVQLVKLLAQARRQLRRALLWLSHGIWRPAGAGFAVGALAVGLASFVLRPTISAPGRVQADSTIAPLTAAKPEPDPEPQPEPEPTPGPEPLPAPQPDPSAAPALARAQQDGEQGVTLVSDGQGVRLSVDLVGTGKGAEQYRLVEPPGVAITLPRGRPRLPLGVYRPANGPVRIQVRRKPGGSHVRFFYDPKLYRGRLAADGAQLILELERR